MAKTRNKNLRQKGRSKRSAVRDERPPVRPEGMPPEAIYIDENNWIMPDALRVAQDIQMNQIFSDRPDTFRRVDGGDDTTPPGQWTWELIMRKRGRPVGSKNRVAGSPRRASSRSPV